MPRSRVSAVPVGTPQLTIHERFQRQAERTPDAVALVFEGQSMSYRELNSRANHVARRLRGLGVGPDVFVGLCVDRSFDTVMGVLAILKAGGAYVPLDPAYPLKRRTFILQDTAAPVVLTSRDLADTIPSGYGKLVILDDLWSSWQENDGENDSLETSATTDNLAYVIHTSGSTGQPKGVLITHANVVRLFDSTENWFRFGPEGVWTLFHSYAFDFSVWEMWGALFYGGRVVIVPYWISRSPHDFYKLLVRERVTFLNQTPSAFRQLMRAEESVQSPGDLALEYVVFGGEALELASLRPWVERHGDARPRLINMYGITETTVHVTYRRLMSHDIVHNGGSLIGVPIPDLEVHVLDERLRPVPIGVTGEVYVGGAGVGRGYLNRPHLTAERFMRNPFLSVPEARLYKTGDLARRLQDGDLEYLGRADNQVQVRGFRVEPGEVEAVLAAHPDVSHAVVVARGAASSHSELVAYIVPAAGRQPGPGTLRAFVAEQLPEYMIPSAFVTVKAMPLTASGKIDRGQLPDPPKQRPELGQAYAAPRTDLEKFLAQLWSQVLELDCIGIHDRFFELGGTSIKAAQLISHVQKELGEFIYVVAVFDAPSIAEFAAFLQREYAPAVWQRFGSPATTPVPGNVDLPARANIRPTDVTKLRTCIPVFTTAARSGERRNPPAMFVLAPPRSGTTLLRVMLAGHPKLFAAPELQLLQFATLQQRRSAFVGKFSLWLEGTIRAIMEIKSCGVEAAKLLMQEYEDKGYSAADFYGVLQEWIGDRVLVDKSPQYTLDRQCLARAERIFDNALYVHLVRHPYSMIRSFERFHVDQVLFLEPHPFSLRQLGELVWLVSHQNTVEFLQTVPQERQCRVRFEDLVAGPTHVMERLCHTLGLEYHPALIDPYGGVAQKMTDGIYPESTPMGDTEFLKHKRIDPRVADSWRAVAHDNFLSEMTWKLAEALGYEGPEGGASVETAKGREQPLSGVRRDSVGQERRRRRSERRAARFDDGEAV